MTLIIKTTVPDEIATLPISNTTNLTINWDADTDSYNFEEPSNTTNPTHLYETAGEYEVLIKGEAVVNTNFGVSTSNYINPNIVGIKYWGENGFKQINSFGQNLQGTIIMPSTDSFKNVTSFAYAFHNCDGLTGIIPEDLFANGPNIASFNSTFYNCSNLTGSIPADLFVNCPNITSFNGTFYNCSGLTGNIPKNLFADSQKVLSFQSVFNNCTGLTGSIPVELFSECQSASQFYQAFYNCSGLTGSIPAGLFDNCERITNFQSTFQNCSGLTEIPTTLFDNCIRATNFYRAFFYCTSLTGEAPELWNMDGTSGTQCFRNCTLLTNYESIPTNWR